MDNNYVKNKLYAIIDEHADDVVDLCSKLIRINSENPPGNMDEIIKFICNYLDDKSIHYEVLEPEKGRLNIVASIGKQNGKTLIINGHVDVVPAGDMTKWDFDPFSGKVENGKILGRGASDMKGGIAGVLYAIGLLADEGIELNGKAVLTIVTDEEISGDKGTKWLVEKYGIKGDACIVAEPTDRDNCEIGQRGTLWLKVFSKGISAHGSLCPYVGKNAITNIIKFIDKLDTLRGMKAKYPKEIAGIIEDSKRAAKDILKNDGTENVIDHVTINVGTIKGGVKTNMIPDYAEAEIDIRIPIGISTAMIIDSINSIINEMGINSISYEYSWRSEPNYTDSKALIVETLSSNVEKIINKKMTRTYQWASSDARYFRYAGIPTLQYGPANTEGIHAYNETVDVKDLVDAAKVYAGTIIDFLNNK